MGAVTFVAFHIITTGAESENISAAIGISFKWFVGWFGKGDEIENVALAAGNFGDNIVAPNNKPDNTGNENENDDKNDTGDDFAFLGHGFFHFLGLKFTFGSMVVDWSVAGLEFAGLIVEIKNLSRGEKILGRREGGVGGMS